MDVDAILKETPLGKKQSYTSEYTPSLLYPIPRWDVRETLDLDATRIPFRGVDIWNAYEMSWLDEKGKPVVGVAEFQIPSNSTNIIESKSFKLYLNSLNQVSFPSKQQVIHLLEKDLSLVAGGPVSVRLADVSYLGDSKISEMPGICLDALDISCDDYQVNPDLLSSGSNVEFETVYSNLLRTNCPVTNQPDWASIMIRYKGQQIDHEGLLKYLVSYRQHNGFHEQVVEQIFMDLWARCKPTMLTVYARYTRRGGLDINPFRSNSEEPLSNWRLIRQ